MLYRGGSPAAAGPIALGEDLTVLLPCLALLIGGAIFCMPGSHAGCDRHQAFIDATICSAMIVLSAERRVHIVLIAATLALMVAFGVLTRMPWGSIVENELFWSVALLASSRAGQLQERSRRHLYAHRVERERQLRRASASRDALLRGARTDALTGTGNRLALDERLRALAGSHAPLREFWLIMVDVDHFRLLGDALPPGAGDACLRAVAATLANCLRADDLLARLGGDAFAALVRTPEAIHAWRIAERMREAVTDLSLTNPRTAAGHVTVSAGIAAIGVGGLGSVIGRADLALNAAKAAGRDRVALEPGFERTGYPLPGMAIPAI